MEELIGHEKISAFFAKVKEQNKLSHAYCFVGPESVGKKYFAQIFGAKLLNTSLAKLNTHPDFCLVTQEYNEKEEKTNKDINISQIRNLRSFLSQSPYLGEYKIAIIDNAEKMNSEAANALLKILEEPTPKTILFLITANETLLPSTITSRAQMLYFAPVAKNVLTKWLESFQTNFAKTELSALSCGLPGKLKNWLAEPESFVDYKKEIERFLSLIGKTFFEKLKIVEDLFTAEEDSVKNKAKWQKLLKLWRLLIRDSELIKNNLGNLAIHQDLKNLSFDKILEIEEKINLTEEALNKNINLRLLIENLLLILP